MTHEAPKIKMAMNKLRAEASRTAMMPTSVVFSLTDPIMDMISRTDIADAKVAKLEAENARLTEALTPSGSTKYAYMSEFSWDREITDKNGDECTETLTVPWTTIKEIMAAITARAALAETEGE